MAAMQTGSGNNGCRTTLGHVVSGISESGMVENVGVAAEIALPSLSVQTLFLLPVYIIVILRFPCRPMSGNVVSDISESGMVANVGAAVGIASPSLSDQKLFLLPVLWPTINHILSSCCRTMSGNVSSDIAESGTVANVG